VVVENGRGCSGVLGKERATCYSRGRSADIVLKSLGIKFRWFTHAQRARVITDSNRCYLFRLDTTLDSRDRVNSFTLFLSFRRGLIAHFL